MVCGCHIAESFARVETTITGSPSVSAIAARHGIVRFAKYPKYGACSSEPA